MSIQILVAEDDPDVALVLCDRLEAKGYEVVAADFLTKPFNHDQLKTVIAKALERKQVTHEVERLLGEISHSLPIHPR